MPVDEVRSMLNAPDDETRNKVIIAHLDRMEAQLAQTTSTVVSLRGLLEGPALSAPVEYRHVAPATALALTSHLRVGAFEPWWERSFGQLRGALAESGLRRTGPDGALFPGEFFEMEEGDVTAYVPVAAPAGASPFPGGGAALVEIAGAELAVMVHEGGYGDTDRTYGALGTAVSIRGLGVDGPIREHYVVGPLDVGASESEWRTEICWPVLRLPQMREATDGQASARGPGGARWRPAASRFMSW